MLKFFKKYWFLISLILLGSFLRLYRLEASLQFLGDQGRDAIVLRNMLVNKDLPFIGPTTSVGSFFLGPFYYYLMAPFLWLSNYNPVGPAIANALIGIITIPVIYFVTKEMLSVYAAQLAALLYTFAAVPINETRSTWNPNPMPLAVLGIVFGFFKAKKTKNPRWLYLSAFSLGIAFQLHYMIVLLAPFILFELINVFRQKKLRKYILVWFLIIILMMLPLILFELKNNFLNLTGLKYYLAKNEYGKVDFLQKFRDLKGRSEQVIGMLLGFGEAFSVLRVWITRIIWIPTLLLLFKKPTKGFLTISLWIFLSIISAVFYQGRIPPYYLGFLFPAVFMLTASLLSRLKGKFSLITYIFIVIFLIFNLKTINQIFSQKGNLQSVRKTASFIKKDIDDKNYQNYNLALLDGTKDYRASSFRYFLELYGGQPLGIDKYPQTNILYVISPYKQENDVVDNPIWEINSLQPTELIDSWEFDDSENIYKIKRKGSFN